MSIKKIPLGLMLAACTGVQVQAVEVQLLFKGQRAVISLADNDASAEFLSLLPLELSFEDYAGAEKIAYLPKKISLKNAPAGYDPALGDVAIYAPWGNLVLFYKDAPYAGGLVPLGRITEGLEYLKSQKGGFSARAERIQQAK